MKCLLFLFALAIVPTGTALAQNACDDECRRRDTECHEKIKMLTDAEDLTALGRLLNGTGASLGAGRGVGAGNPGAVATSLAWWFGNLLLTKGDKGKNALAEEAASICHSPAAHVAVVEVSTR